MYFYRTYVGLYNGLIHINLSHLVFILFLALLAFNIITLTGFYPFEITKANSSEHKFQYNNPKQSLSEIEELELNSGKELELNSEKDNSISEDTI